MTISRVKLTPAQHALLKQLRQEGPRTTNTVHTATLQGLQRRGLAIVEDGMARATSLTGGVA